MQSMDKLSKAACERYANVPGDLAQQRFRYALNRFIRRGLSVPEAEAKALASVRNTDPDFVPRRA
jgi:hypothetical protein